jgi:4a-hydroxytetrahydrobiopterin dehydratase
MDGSGAGNLASRHCVPCRGGVPPLQGEELRKLSDQLPEWLVINEHHIERTFLFPDFKTALALVNKIGAVAEEEGHHPDICFGWGSVKVTLFTHKISGLTESDFVLAAKIDEQFLKH